LSWPYIHNFLLTLSLMELDNIIYNGQNITATP
jgi:hypothetical protein